MAGKKEACQVALNEDQVAFLRAAAQTYELADEDKALRIILDYVLSNPGLHQDIFTEVRCLRCE